ncbi:hypothetical protein Tco_0599899 [Tanacetum coccineum]
MSGDNVDNAHAMDQVLEQIRSICTTAEEKGQASRQLKKPQEKEVTLSTIKDIAILMLKLKRKVDVIDAEQAKHTTLTVKCNPGHLMNNLRH